MSGDAPVEERPDLVVAVRDGERLPADAYLPAGDGPFPAFVLFHGGAFTKGSRTSYARWGRWLAAHGYVALAASYRLARPGRPSYPAAIEDARAGVRFARDSADRLRVDPARIGVLGGSAGGYLAAMVALTAEDPSEAPSVAVPMAGVFDLVRFWIHDRTARPPDDQSVELFIGGTPLDRRREYFEASPLFHASAVNARRARWLVSWGTHDDVVPPADHSEALVAQLKLAGAVVRTVPLLGAPHFWYLDSDPADPASPSGAFGARLLAFLETWSGW